MAVAVQLPSSCEPELDGLEVRSAPFSSKVELISAPPPTSVSFAGQVTDPVTVVPTAAPAPVSSVGPSTRSTELSPAPVGPVAPVAPVEPVAPSAPVAPAVPVGPLSPVGPAAPVVPVMPVAPVAPFRPSAPVAPAVPVGPLSPVGPVAPVGPVGPVFGAADATWTPLKNTSRHSVLASLRWFTNLIAAAAPRRALNALITQPPCCRRRRPGPPMRQVNQLGRHRRRFWTPVRRETTATPQSTNEPRSRVVRRCAVRPDYLAVNIVSHHAAYGTPSAQSAR
jgi:hypothetical protein